MQKYELLVRLAYGSYGKVFKAINTETNEFVAVKRPLSKLLEDGIPPTTIREISLLSALSKDQHIVKLRAVHHVRHWLGDPIPVEPESEPESEDVEAEDGEKPKKPETPKVPKKPIPLVYMIFDHLDMDLKDALDDYRKNNDRVPLKLVKEYMFQLLTGICYCHSLGVLHRDLKPQNILVDKEHSFLKIADFGLGREYSIPAKRYTKEVVTLWYRAPELLLETDYSTPVDIWSLGCIFAELIRMVPLFSAVSELEQLLVIFRVMGTPTEAEWQGVTSFKTWNENYPRWRKRDIKKWARELCDDGIDLLSKMLVYNPSERISARSALSHPYFKDLDQNFLRTHQLL